MGRVVWHGEMLRDKSEGRMLGKRQEKDLTECQLIEK